MSASFYGGEIKATKRYRLGQLLATVTRNFLLMTATPHNGKEEDFQLFMALLDGDRFEGNFRDGVHTVDASDMMRGWSRKTSEIRRHAPVPGADRLHGQLRPVGCRSRLYKQVTDYVREEFNRAEALENDGRKGTVGFALLFSNVGWPPRLRPFISHFAVAASAWKSDSVRNNFSSEGPRRGLTRMQGCRSIPLTTWRNSTTPRMTRSKRPKRRSWIRRRRHALLPNSRLKSES